MCIGSPPTEFSSSKRAFTIDPGHLGDLQLTGTGKDHVARIKALAEETLGSRQKAARWLRAPNRALGGEPPVNLLNTASGVRRIKDLLRRISHGVFS